MTLDKYIAGLRSKRVAVIGLGVSNTPLLRLLLRGGVEVLACDQKERAELGGLAEELESLGAQLRLGSSYLQDLDADVIFRSPGMHPETPELLSAKSRGALISSEMEVFFQLCPCPSIGVTGSDGKTTTTTIISEFFKKAGLHYHLGGNIGRPLLPDVGSMLEDDTAILELSSFQLITMKQSPNIAVITNLAPNHLDVHKSMAEYISAKENIFLHQGPEDLLVLNLDNEITRTFAKSARGRVRFFSRRERPENGVWFKDDLVLAVRGDRDEPILRAGDILLPGVHNLENYMAAIAATDGIIPHEVMRAVAREFTGVEHRAELVRRLNGVSYYNDSIASSPSRTIAGLEAFRQKVILIAGGYDKHLSYDSLGPVICRRVKTLVLTGATGPAIRSAVRGCAEYSEGHPKIIEKADFYDAVHAAVSEAKDGDCVLLSPASASFDSFKNFAERGEAFKKVIYELE